MAIRMHQPFLYAFEMPYLHTYYSTYVIVSCIMVSKKMVFTRL